MCKRCSIRTIYLSPRGYCLTCRFSAVVEGSATLSEQPVVVREVA